MIDRKLYKGSFDKNQLNNNWRCPKCKKGSLCTFGNNIFVEKDAVTIEWSKDSETYSSPYCASYVYTTILVCSNQDCLEKVICSGTSGMDYSDTIVNSNGIYEDKYEMYYKPLFFYPAVHFFDIPSNTPEEISKTIIESFSLSFSNYSAAINKIRIALEKLLTALDVDETTSTDKQEQEKRHISLHKQISLLKGKDENIKKECEAIKWLGNSGSHGDDKIQFDDVLDGYDLLSFVLEKLYDKKASKIVEIASRLNSKKGA